MTFCDCGKLAVTNRVVTEVGEWERDERFPMPEACIGMLKIAMQAQVIPLCEVCAVVYDTNNAG